MTYDAQGNVDVKDNYSYAFDYGNRLRQVTQASTLLEWYAYDGQGRRVLSCGTSTHSVEERCLKNGVRVGHPQL